jgi:hypothetical protein
VEGMWRMREKEGASSMSRRSHNRRVWKQSG